MANELPGIPPGIDLMQIPASPLPPGVKSDFNKREPLLDATIALTAVFLPLMYVFFGLRVYVRLRHSQKWMIDDTTITALSTTALAVVTLLLAPKMAKHFWDLPVGVLRSPTTQKTMVAQVIFLSSSAFLGKHCLLTIYYRIFGHIPKVRWQLLGTAILTLPLFSGIIVYPILVGPPVGKPWGTPHPKEADAVIPNLMMGIDNIPVDLCIAYIPIPVIQTLKLSTTRKRGIVALFTTGFIAVLSSIVILYFRIQIFRGIQDNIYAYTGLICSLIESSLSVILSSLPSLAKLWRVYIEPSPIFQSLKIRFSRSESREISSRHSLPTFVKEGANVHQPKRRDPYSIGIRTGTNTSQTCLSEDPNNDIGLNLNTHGLLDDAERRASSTRSL